MNINVILIIKTIAIIILLIVMSKQNLFVRKNGLYKKITLIVFLCIAGYYLFYLFPIISEFDKFVLFFLSGFTSLFLLYLIIIEIVGLATKKESDNLEDTIGESINDTMLENNYKYKNYNTREKRHSSNLLDNIYNLYVQDCEKILKAPGTARFCNKEDLVITKQNGVYTVSGWVDSQNSYGAFIRTRLSIKIVYEDGLLIIKSHASKSAAKSFLGNMAARYIIGIIFTLITFAIFYFIFSEF